MNKFLVLAVALTVAVLAGSSMSKAQTQTIILPNATVFGAIAVAGDAGFGVMQVKQSDTTQISFSSALAFVDASVQVNTNPSPGLSLLAGARASTGGTAIVNIGLVAMSYSMLIVGPPGTVPITIVGKGGQAAIPGSSGPGALTAVTLYSRIYVDGAEAQSSIHYDPLSSNPDKGASFYTGKIWSDLLLETNTIYPVTLYAYIDPFTEYDSGSIIFTDYVDPQFIIGGDDPSDYSLVFSPGIGNGPIGGAVPEPSTWAMLLIGFAGLGFAGLRRRAKTRTVGG
jgi:PEP-CTERM motif